MDGELIEVTDQPPKLAKAKSHTIEAVVDRIAIREGIRPRLAESLDLALKLSDGGVVTLTESPEGWVEQFFSIHSTVPIAAPACRRSSRAASASTAPTVPARYARGWARAGRFKPELAVPDRSRSWDEGAVAPWALLPAAVKDAALLRVAGQGVSDSDIASTGSSPLDSWPAEDLELVLVG